jgi:hypothetical protein
MTLRYLLQGAFVCLFVEIGLAVALFVAFFGRIIINRRSCRRASLGEDATDVQLSATDFSIELRNHETGAVVRVTGPRAGVFQDPAQVIQSDDAYRLAGELAHLMRRVTGEAEMTMGG